MEQPALLNWLRASIETISAGRNWVSSGKLTSQISPRRGYESFGTGAAPWKEDAGYLRDSPVYEPWREAIEEYRRQLDDDPEAL